MSYYDDFEAPYELYEKWTKGAKRSVSKERMMRVRFDEIKIGAKFRDSFYSGDWCIKTADTLARPVEGAYPMCYSIGPDSVVEIPDLERDAANRRIRDE